LSWLRPIAVFFWWLAKVEVALLFAPIAVLRVWLPVAGTEMDPSAVVADITGVPVAEAVP
jgi:hypothetical protein